MKMTSCRLRARSKRRRSNKRKREEEVSLNDSHLKTDEAKTMGEMELKNAKLVKEMVP